MDAMAYMFSVAREDSSNVLEFKPECIMEEDLMSLSSKFPLIPGSQRSITFCTTTLSQKVRNEPFHANFVVILNWGKHGANYCVCLWLRCQIIAKTFDVWNIETLWCPRKRTISFWPNFPCFCGFCLYICQICGEKKKQTNKNTTQAARSSIFKL